MLHRDSHCIRTVDKTSRIFKKPVLVQRVTWKSSKRYGRAGSDRRSLQDTFRQLLTCKIWQSCLQFGCNHPFRISFQTRFFFFLNIGKGKSEGLWSGIQRKRCSADSIYTIKITERNGSVSFFVAVAFCYVLFSFIFKPNSCPTRHQAYVFLSTPPSGFPFI